MFGCVLSVGEKKEVALSASSPCQPRHLVISFGLPAFCLVHLRANWRPSLHCVAGSSPAEPDHRKPHEAERCETGSPLRLTFPPELKGRIKAAAIISFGCVPVGPVCKYELLSALCLVHTFISFSQFNPALCVFPTPYLYINTEGPILCSS